MQAAADAITALLQKRMPAAGPNADAARRTVRSLETLVRSTREGAPSKWLVMAERLQHLHAALVDDPAHARPATRRAWRRLTGTDLSMLTLQDPADALEGDDDIDSEAAPVDSKRSERTVQENVEFILTFGECPATEDERRYAQQVAVELAGASAVEVMKRLIEEKERVGIQRWGLLEDLLATEAGVEAARLLRQPNSTGVSASDRDLYMWFVSANGYTPDNRPPADLLTEDPEAVLLAARIAAEPSW